MYTLERYRWTDQTVISIESFLYVNSREVWVDRSDCDQHRIIPICTLQRGMGRQIRL